MKTICIYSTYKYIDDTLFDDNEDDDLLIMQFKYVQRRLSNFFDKIKTGQRTQIALTKAALKRKTLIKAHIDTLKSDVNKILKQKKWVYDAKNLDVNEHMIYKYDDQQFKCNYSNLNCNICHKTCHTSCDAWWKGACVVIDRNNVCKLCGCTKTKHEREKKYWKCVYIKDLKMTQQVISDQIKHLTKILEGSECELYGKIGRIIIFLDEFNEIALKPTKYTIKQYINILIDQEMNGDRNEKVLQYLKDLKKENVINAITEYSNAIKKKGVKFVDLSHTKLQDYYKNIICIVKNEMNK